MLSSSGSDLLMRRSPGSLCDGTWKVEKELPRDGLFSEDKRGDKQDMVTAAAFPRWGFSRRTGEMSRSAVIVLYFEAPRGVRVVYMFMSK